MRIIYSLLVLLLTSAVASAVKKASPTVKKPLPKHGSVAKPHPPTTPIPSMNLTCDERNGQAIYHVQRVLDPKTKKTHFQWKCHTVSTTPLTDCMWTNRIEEWNDNVLYMCPPNYIVTGISSKFIKKQRKWSVRCCQSDGYFTKNCKIKESGKGKQKKLKVKASSCPETIVFSGMESVVKKVTKSPIAPSWKIVQCVYTNTTNSKSCKEKLTTKTHQDKKIKLGAKQRKGKTNAKEKHVQKSKKGKKIKQKSKIMVSGLQPMVGDPKKLKRHHKHRLHSDIESGLDHHNGHSRTHHNHRSSHRQQRRQHLDSELETSRKHHSRKRTRHARHRLESDQGRHHHHSRHHSHHTKHHHENNHEEQSNQDMSNVIEDTPQETPGPPRYYEESAIPLQKELDKEESALPPPTGVRNGKNANSGLNNVESAIPGQPGNAAPPVPGNNAPQINPVGNGFQPNQLRPVPGSFPLNAGQGGLLPYSNGGMLPSPNGGMLPTTRNRFLRPIPILYKPNPAQYNPQLPGNTPGNMPQSGDPQSPGNQPPLPNGNQPKSIIPVQNLQQLQDTYSKFGQALRQLRMVNSLDDAQHVTYIVPYLRRLRNLRSNIFNQLESLGYPPNNPMALPPYMNHGDNFQRLKYQYLLRQLNRIYPLADPLQLFPYGRGLSNMNVRYGGLLDRLRTILHPDRLSSANSDPTLDLLDRLRMAENKPNQVHIHHHHDDIESKYGPLLEKIRKLVDKRDKHVVVHHHHDDDTYGHASPHHHDEHIIESPYHTHHPYHSDVIHHTVHSEPSDDLLYNDLRSKLIDKLHRIPSHIHYHDGDSLRQDRFRDLRSMYDQLLEKLHGVPPRVHYHTRYGDPLHGIMTDRYADLVDKLNAHPGNHIHIHLPPENQPPYDQIKNLKQKYQRLIDYLHTYSPSQVHYHVPEVMTTPRVKSDNHQDVAHLIHQIQQHPIPVPLPSSPGNSVKVHVPESHPDIRADKIQRGNQKRYDYNGLQNDYRINRDQIYNRPPPPMRIRYRIPANTAPAYNYDQRGYVPMYSDNRESAERSGSESDVNALRLDQVKGHNLNAIKVEQQTITS